MEELDQRIIYQQVYCAVFDAFKDVLSDPKLKQSVLNMVTDFNEACRESGKLDEMIQVVHLDELSEKDEWRLSVRNAVKCVGLQTGMRFGKPKCSINLSRD